LSSQVHRLVESESSVRLTIGLPVYNGEQFLAETLECLLGQTFGDFTLIICDNASTDETPEICLDYAKRDRRVQVSRNSVNVGAIGNFNRAFKLATTPLFKWAAHDDLYQPEYLANCMRILDDNPDVVLAHSGTAFIDESGKAFPFDPATGTYVDPKVGVPQKPDSSEVGRSLQPVARFWDVLVGARWGSHMFGIMRRDALLRAGPLLNFAGSDRAMLAGLALLGRFEAIDERLYLKRFHGDGSWALNQKQLKSFLGGNANYSRRSRQMQAFFSAPLDKPIGIMKKAACVGLVAAHSLRTVAQMAGGKEARNAAHGAIWRNKARARDNLAMIASQNVKGQ
jgi:glycosyltransferase involved in cell wall biosynthesis